MDKPNFVYVTYIQTTAEKLWKALITPEFQRQYWFDIAFETDWRVGSNFVALSTDGTRGISGKVLEFDPPHRMSYTFIPKQAPKGSEHDTGSRVVMQLETLGAQVKLTVTHDHFAPGSTLIDSISQGWPAVLSGLKSLLETGKALEISGPCASKK